MLVKRNAKLSRVLFGVPALFAEVKCPGTRLEDLIVQYLPGVSKTGVFFLLLFFGVFFFESWQFAVLLFIWAKKILTSTDGL
jgi:hypothetical protein